MLLGNDEGGVGWWGEASTTVGSESGEDAILTFTFLPFIYLVFPGLVKGHFCAI